MLWPRVPGLSHGPDDFVYWRGISVEHYSYSPDQRQEMIDSARVLGAVCMTLEQAGQEVNSLSVMRFFDRLREGPDGPSLRYCALWVVKKSGPRMVIQTLTAETRADILSEIDVLKDAFINKPWGADRMALRCFAVYSKEDVSALLREFESDRNWTRLQSPVQSLDSTRPDCPSWMRTWPPTAVMKG
ncbi:MAG: hypothetical protein DDT39_01672 [Firmicutes bacterium]|nr:hypothetical protein [candidate division NPL-UPA2 bacterium]